MGPWAKRTRLRWRWSQFRFEILFTTPEIRLRPYLRSYEDCQIGGPLWDHDFQWITGSEDSKIHTLVDPYNPQNRSDERVCWLSLLASLQVQESNLERLKCYQPLHGPWEDPDLSLVRPALKPREWSWDFMSPDIVRPFAVTTVCDIAVLARRLGMEWKDFRPEEGIIRAEGNGHLITSTVARSIGIILHYMHSGRHTYNVYSKVKETLTPAVCAYIPTSEADRMGFGIVPGCSFLHLPEFKMGTIEEVYATTNILDSSGKAAKKLRDIRSLVPRVTFGFSDLVPLAAPMMRLRGSTVIRVPIPSEYCVGLTCHQEGFVVFHHRLKEYISEKDGAVSEQTKWVLERYEELRARYVEWEDEVEANKECDNRDLQFLERVHTGWDQATDYFSKLEQSFKSKPLHFRYYDLMACHVTHAVNYWGDAWSHMRGDDGKKPRDHFGLRDWIAEGAHMYFDYLPEIVSDMRRKGFDREDLVHEAWFTMMFRAFCWWRCHFLNPGQDMIQSPSILPSRYWNSELPVYIG